jgi:sodium pump decarboxylase gamma subunit
MSTEMLALKLTVMGIGTVFSILSILGLLLHCLKLIFNREAKANPGPDASETITLPSENQAELVAVIAAASHIARLRWMQPVLVKVAIPAWDEKQHSSWLEAGRRGIIDSRLA